MGERVKSTLERIKEFVDKLSLRVRIIILASIVLVVAGIIALIVINRANQQPYVILFTGLNNADMAQVMRYMAENGSYDYRLEGDDTILVKESQEAQLRAQIYQQGYPNSGFNYGTYLDNVGILASESDRKTLKLYELMDRLSATVQLMDGVRYARVNLTEGSDDTFILSDRTVAATASVVVEMEPARHMTEQLVEAIRNLISRSAEGLDITEVDVTDTAGNRYTSTEGEKGYTTLVDSAELKLTLQAQVDNNVRNKIIQSLTPVFGADNFTVSVSSTVDLNRTYIEDMTYKEPDWADGSGQGIINSRVWGNYLLRDDTTGTAGGTVGTTTNADLNEYVVNEGELNGSEAEVNTSGRVDYNVSYTKTQTEPLGIVTDISVAVAINSNSSESAINTEPLVALIARAAGVNAEYQADKISVVVMPFYREPVPEPEETGEGEEETWLFGLPRWVLYAAIGGVVLFLALLTVILLLRKKKNKEKEQKEQEDALALEELMSFTPEQFAQLTPEQLATYTPDQIAQFQAEMAHITSEQAARKSDIMDLHSERSMELRKDVRQFAEDNPAIAAQMIKNWLRGDENHG